MCVFVILLSIRWCDLYYLVLCNCLDIRAQTFNRKCMELGRVHVKFPQGCFPNLSSLPLNERSSSWNKSRELSKGIIFQHVRNSFESGPFGRTQASISFSWSSNIPPSRMVSPFVIKADVDRQSRSGFSRERLVLALIPLGAHPGFHSDKPFHSDIHSDKYFTRTK